MTQTQTHAFVNNDITIHAMQLTEDNHDLISKYCNGSIRGTKLPPSERIVQFYFDDAEHEINVGDWLVLYFTKKNVIRQVWKTEHFQTVFSLH
jgi:hypothetical protein